MRPLRDPPFLRMLTCAVLLGGCDGPATTGTRAVVPPARLAAVGAGAAPAAAPQMVRRAPVIDAQHADGAFTNVFAATSWQPPSAPAPPPSAVVAQAVAIVPAAPVAPPLPFRYIGLYGDADSQVVMLVKGDQLYLVAVGETIDNAYRIERVSGTTVELTYLPLKLTQSLSTGGAG